MPSKGKTAEIGEIIDVIKSYNDDMFIEEYELEDEVEDRKPVSKI